ncbi:MAG: flavodoxin family protein [Syntrophobacteraceae bacterium]
MKIVCLLGSPRDQGNSSTLAKHFCSTAEKLGAEIRIFGLNKLEYKGCQACMACKTNLDKCVLQDDLTEVLEEVASTDVLVMASPVYFWDISSQLKAFMDRTYSYLVPDFIMNPVKSRLAPGKKLVFILAQGQPDESLFTNIFPKFDHFFKMFGFSETHLIRACGVRLPGEVATRPGVMRLAEETAETLVAQGG